MLGCEDGGRPYGPLICEAPILLAIRQKNDVPLRAPFVRYASVDNHLIRGCMRCLHVQQKQYQYR